MVKATWKDEVIAESQNTIMIEGNHYFPPQDVRIRVPGRQRLSFYLPLEGRSPLLRHSGQR